MSAHEFEFGLDTFVQVTVDESGRLLDGNQVIRNTIEEAVFADSVGIDSFNIGEHYRPEFMDSAGHVILAAIAGRTERIRLGTGVTVLSSQDPVRVYTNFATLDAVSKVALSSSSVAARSRSRSRCSVSISPTTKRCRGEARLAHTPASRSTRHMVWHRAIAAHRPIREPSLAAGHIPTWVGVGGSPQSVVRATRSGLPLVLAIIGGDSGASHRCVDL